MKQDITNPDEGGEVFVFADRIVNCDRTKVYGEIHRNSVSCPLLCGSSQSRL